MISDLTIELDRLNVLIGSNNCGKSSILQAIQFAVSVAQSAKLDNASRWLRNTRTTTLASSQLIYSPLRDVEALAHGMRFTQNQRDAIELELINIDGNIIKIIVRRGKNKNIHVKIEGSVLGQELEKINEPYSIFVPGLAGIPAVEEFRAPSIVRKAAAKGDANNVFRNVLWLLRQQEEQWQIFTHDLNLIFPNTQVDVIFNDDQDEIINASLIHNGKILPIDASGTGCLQAIQILSYVNVYRPKLLVLDEPDSHLHPTNQKCLVRLLSQLAFDRNIQIVLATHSRHVTDELWYLAKMHWVKDGIVVEDEELDVADILLEIGALDKGDLLQNGNIKYVILTEDKRYKYLEALLASSGFKMNEVDIWPYYGCTKIETAIALSQFIKRHAPASRILIHRDRDYCTDEELASYINVLEEHGLEHFITIGNDCEYYFLRAEHLNALYPQITIQRAQEILDQVTMDTRNASISKFTNTRFNIERTYNGQKNPDAFNITKSCEDKYDQNPTLLRHGKTVIGPLKAALQKELQQNITLCRESNFIGDYTLKALAQQVWPANNKHTI